MTLEKLTEILEKHKKWLNDEIGGSRADLSGADLRYANLRYADLRCANLSGADLSEADLSRANLSGADLSGADLSRANLRYANLSEADLSRANLRYANLRYADLSRADLSGADLSGADLSGADLRYANLSEANGLLSTINFMESHFERTEKGYIAYKTFNSQYRAPDSWKIESGSIITENVNFNRTQDCGSGINVAPLEWVKKNYNGDVWKVLIRWEWLCGVCVPYSTDGKIRCEKVELIGIVR